MPIMLGITVRIGRRSNIPYIGVYLIATSNGGYHVYTTKLS